MSVNIGDVFGRWVVISVGEYFYEVSKTRVKRCKGWLCECTCGTVRSVKQATLLSGNSRSCGCLLKDKQRLKKETSGKSEQARTRKIHLNMVRRCTLESVAEYPLYGGRGITVCDRWLESGRRGFFNFLEDMGLAPEGMSLDRIDVNGNYEPSNCRWTDTSTQAYNKRRSHANTSGRTGVYWHKGGEKWVARIMKNKVMIELYYGDSLEDAIRAREEAEIKYYGELKPEAREGS